MIASRVRDTAWGVFLTLALATPAMAGRDTAITVAPSSAVAVHALQVRTGGRTERGGTPAAPVYERQWPGGYFETAFVGREAYFRLGSGDVILRVTVDDRPGVRMVRPGAGLYVVQGISAGVHRVRVQVVSESQEGPSSFLGFYGGVRTKAHPIPARARQIEFIGDSHTVGYGNTSDTRACNRDKVWETTDTSRGIAGIAAARYRADYQVNAISGRGVVRNYNGAAADTLPAAYPFVLFDKATGYADPRWRPQVIVVALGTNDFSTPLRPGEPWQDRAALHADFETKYVAFIQNLRARNRKAFIIVWATDLAGGEIAAEARKVVDRVQELGERRVAFVPVAHLALSACNGHPSIADDRIIAEALARVIDAQAGIWNVTPD
jgi:lysophospholipase L1-like esterase